MARPLRIQFAGALYHVMSRGNETRPIVRDDADRSKRLDWLRRTVDLYGWHFGYSASQVAAALGYRSHSGVSNAIARFDSASPAIQRTAEDLTRRLH